VNQSIRIAFCPFAEQGHHPCVQPPPEGPGLSKHERAFLWPSRGVCGPDSSPPLIRSLLH
jgi:hypothetical protein